MYSDERADIQELGPRQAQKRRAARLAIDISRLETAPSGTQAARLAAAPVDQAGATVKPRRQEMFDSDDTFCAAYPVPRIAATRTIARCARSPPHPTPSTRRLGA